MKILLATDGSEFSFAAAKKCCELLSLNQDTEIRILSVMERIIPVEPFSMSDKYFEIAQKATVEVAEAIVEDTRQAIFAMLKDLNLEIETKTITGNPKETIVEEAEEWGADLIVVGSQGHGFWGRIFLGSVSNAVVKHAHCSVLVVRKDEK